jgi:adenylylsulfate kinase
VDKGEGKARTILITGISASGKTTLGIGLKEALLGDGIGNVKLLDGEDVREELKKRGKNFGRSTKERNKVAMEIAGMALEYNKAGMVCVISSICHKRETRKQMRSLIGNVMEVYLECSVDVCARRDHKDNYTKAFRGQYDTFIGVTEPYEVSDNAELILYTGKNTIDECLSVLFKKTKIFLVAENDKMYEMANMGEN